LIINSGVIASTGPRLSLLGVAVAVVVTVFMVSGGLGVVMIVLEGALH
jgi:hypothetical protein